MISVIIPVYNLENYIERTIKSVCAQTDKDLEIIVVDDGSSDNSFEIVKKLSQKDKRIIPIRQENKGVTRARLKGASVANGDWIGFVDGDDEIEKDMFEFLLNNAINYNADISHCGYKMIFSDGRVNQFYGTGQVIEQDKNKGIIDLLEGTIIEPSLCNKLFRKSLVDEMLRTEKMDFSIKNNEDLLMNYYLFSLSEKSVFEDLCKYNYIARGSSASRKISNKIIYDIIKVKEVILKDATQDILPNAQAAYLGTCVTVYSSLIASKNSDKNDINYVREKIISAKDYKNLLGKRTRILFELLYHCPFTFKILYRIYFKYFQKKKYG